MYCFPNNHNLFHTENKPSVFHICIILKGKIQNKVLRLTTAIYIILVTAFGWLKQKS